MEGLVEGLCLQRLDKRDLPWYNNHGRLPGVGLGDCDENHHNLVNYHIAVCNQPFVNTKSEHSVHLLPCSLSCISNRDRSLLSGVPKYEAMGKNESSSAKSGAALFFYSFISFGLKKFSLRFNVAWILLMSFCVVQITVNFCSLYFCILYFFCSVYFI